MEVKAYKISNAIRLRLKELSETIVKNGKVRTANKSAVQLFRNIRKVDNDYYIFVDAISEQTDEDLLKTLSPEIEANIATFTLFMCEYCTGAQPFMSTHPGSLMNHIYTNHNQHFIDMAMSNAEIKNVGQFLNEDEFHCDYWDKSNPNSEIATAKTDQEEQTEIEIRRDFNEFGVAFYTLTIEHAPEDNEVQDSAVIAQHNYYDIEELEDEQEINRAEEIDQLADKEINTWLKRKPYNKAISYQQRLKIEPIIINRECHLQTTHTHRYKGFKLTLHVTDTALLAAILKARYEIFDLWQKLTEA